MNLTLKERQLQILKLIIQNYAQTNKAIGSKALIDKGIKASSATIRNDMSVLETLGLIEKNHTSSGRQPTISGYKLYVEGLLSATLQKQRNETLRRSLAGNFPKLTDLLSYSAQLLSEVTNTTTFLFSPSMDLRRLTDFQLFKLNHTQKIVLLVYDYTQVETNILSVGEHLPEEELLRLATLVQERFIGKQFGEIQQQVRMNLPMVMYQMFHFPSEIAALLETIFLNDATRQVYIAGKMNFLQSVEATSIAAFKEMYHFFTQDEQLVQLIEQKTKEDSFATRVFIGKDLGHPLLEEMSLITTHYEITNHGVGSIALLGANNMNYEKTLSLVHSFSMELSERLNEYYRYLDTNSFTERRKEWL
ncbi:heat-inducible transcription repressor HrcA [Pilibacter termitis]|uniref:Heat-inducible transcription repressor HrcA n=1 Tax=Pilibacter termitis TaxID=263852 RepID=A0A1T4NL63_9ENTE|nr:heat-inducible transcriptional repressor HrcA [Pilibacter termitis]SJZ80020.1 heat-inducible transcription repressor HrcA [Pilibacter termitis]